MKARLVFAAAIALVFAAGVGAGAALAQDVAVNYMPGTDFAKYKTYKWVVIEGAEKPNQIVDAQIMQAVDTALATKGLKKATGDTADLAIGYQVAITQQKEWNAYGTGMGYGYRWGGGMGTATASTTTINVGTLDLDMYDIAAKQLVWKGQATKTLNPSNNPEKNQQNLNKAMAKLLKDFPPKPKK